MNAKKAKSARKAAALVADQMKVPQNNLYARTKTGDVVLMRCRRKIYQEMKKIGAH